MNRRLGSSDPNVVAAVITSIKKSLANLTDQFGVTTAISQIIFCREITGSFARFKPLVNNEFHPSADSLISSNFTALLS